MNTWADLTEEQRAARTAKGVATRRRNIEERRQRHLDLKAQLDPLKQQLDALKAEKASLESSIESHKASVAASTAIDGKRLLSADELVSAARPFRGTRGVYFLVDKDEVVYVGQSVNIYSRVQAHATDRYSTKPFGSFCYVECESAHLDAIESLYIHTLKPSLNGSYPDGSKQAPLSLQQLMSKLR